MSGTGSREVPLNGERTHPLSAHALEILGRLSRSTHMPRQEINPGVANHLEREALVELIDAPSPYRTGKRTVVAIRITDAGRAALAARIANA